MANLYLVPEWFFGLDVAFELAFAIITLLVSLSAFKAHKLSGQNQHKLFGISFLLFSISYFIQSLINFSILNKLEEGVGLIYNINKILVLNFVGFYLHMILFLVGLSTLAYLTLKIKNKRAYLLILLISLLSFLLSVNKAYIFYVLSSLMLIFIVSFFAINYFQNKQKTTLLVFISFLFLLFGHIHFIVSVNHAVFYAIGHFLELIAYILILINLIIILKK